MRRGRFRWGIFLAALVLSVAWHVGYLVPQVIAPLLRPPEAPLEVAYVPEPAGPESSAPASAEPKLPPPTPESAAPLPPKPLSPPPEAAQLERPKPTEVKPVPAPPMPPPPPIDHRKQMVDQDRFEDESDNANAKYLAQKNHRTTQETRANQTNLVRETEGATKLSEPSENHDPEVGAKDRKIAELENHAGPDKSLPRSSPMHGNEGSQVKAEPAKPGPLAMRDLTPRAAIDPVAGEQAREGLDKQELGPGDLPMARVGSAAERGVAERKGGHAALKLDHHNYDNIEGYATAEKERRAAARAESSHAPGRYQRFLSKAQAMRSSLENFTFDVKPGNQSELGTRASPFAAYITGMHRQIHKLWTFGFLADLDGKMAGKDLYSNFELWTQLEIVLKGDGSVDKVGIVHPSGVLPFDVAAIDAVMSAAPFPVPPKAIKSANGKVYMDWQFHRDERACGTFGVDPHILTTPGNNAEHDTSETGREAHELMKRASEGPRTLARNHPSHEELPTARPSTAPEVVVPEVTAEVRAAAEGWFAAYARGDAAWLAGWSAAPFTAAGEIVVKESGKVKAMYQQLLAEAPSGRRAVSGLEVLTPAGIRGRLGGLPPGGADSGMLYAVGKAGGEEFILLLRKASTGWRVCGLDR